MKFKRAKNIRDYGRVKKECRYYPNILDENPELAAEYLTKTESLEALEKLTKSFEAISNGTTTNIILEDSIMHNVDTFNWFIKFYNKLKDIHCADSTTLPYIVAPSNNEVGIFIQEPFHFNTANTGTYDKIQIKGFNPVLKYRIKYIGKHYEVEDFCGGYPSWYYLTDMTVFESYNEKLNVRIKIEHKRGEFIYYMSGASDDWQLISEVPIEIDYVVSALLFRN